MIGSVREAIQIGREANIAVHFAHLKALGVDVWGEAGKIVAEVNAARAAGQDVTADQYPWLTSGSSVEASLLPGWSLDGGAPKMLRRFDGKEQIARIRSEMAKNMRRRGGASAMLMIERDFPWTGNTLAEIAQGWQVDPIDAALRIIRDGAEAVQAGRQTRTGTDIASFNMTDADVDLLMQQPWMVTSSDGSDGHPRMFATFPQRLCQNADVTVDGRVSI